MVVTSQYSLEIGCHLFHLGEGSLKQVVIGPSLLFAKADRSKFKIRQKGSQLRLRLQCPSNIEATISGSGP